MPDFKLLPRQLQRLSEFHIVVGIEERQVAVVQHLIDVSQQSNVFNQRILLLRVHLVSGLCIKFPSSAMKIGMGTTAIAFDKAEWPRIAAIVGSQLRQRCEGAIVAGMRFQRGEISRVGRGGVACLCFVFTQFVVQPGEILAGELASTPSVTAVFIRLMAAGVSPAMNLR